VSVAGTVYLAEKLMDSGLINTPEDYIEFLNNPESEKSVSLVFELFKTETKE
jgi:hypothetical protein